MKPINKNEQTRWDDLRLLNTRNEIIVLVEGYSAFCEDGFSRANCSSVLIKAPNDVNVIVDTLTAWDGDRLIKELQKNGLTPDDISYVICSHGHADHVGCNYLFKSAEWHVVGACIHHKNKFLDTDFERYDYELVEGIRIMHTPGHTPECVSVIVKGTFQFQEEENVLVAITGDLFEKEEDIDNPLLWMSCGSGAKDAKVQQMESRYRVIDKVDVIIPGHGPFFKVTESQVNEVKGQYEETLS